MPTYLLDTDVIIDALNRKRGWAALLEKLLLDGHRLACCAINVVEVYAGMRAAEEPRTVEFLGSLDYYEISPEAARRAGLLKRDWARKGTALNIQDALIAATALENDLMLVTGNARHYPMPELRLFPLEAR
jgi:tRNA(fMet)-specific endonuclease VapC